MYFFVYLVGARWWWWCGDHFISKKCGGEQLVSSYILAVTFYTTKTEANKCKWVLFAIFSCWNFLYIQNTESKWCQRCLFTWFTCWKFLYCWNFVFIHFRFNLRVTSHKTRRWKMCWWRWRNGPFVAELCVKLLRLMFYLLLLNFNYAPVCGLFVDCDVWDYWTKYFYFCYA